MDQVNIQLSDISLQSFNVIGPLRQEQSEIGLDINTSFDSGVDRPLVKGNVFVRFYYKDSIDETILDGKVATTFMLPGVEGDIKKIDLPDQVFITMLSLSISNARALILHHTKSAGLNGFMIPIVNPTEIYNRMKEKIKKS